MKSIVIICLFVNSVSTLPAQTISISGTVKNAHGQPIPMAFVRDMQHYYATYADSTGTFLLKADPASTLAAIAPNYADADIKIGGKTAVEIVMNKGVSSSARTAINTAESVDLSTLSSYLNKQAIVSQTGSSTAIKAGFVQEPTRGSPYLYTNWAHGFAIGTGDSLFYDINNLYNYDKVSGNLVFTKDGVNILQANKQGIKYFSLFNGKIHPAIFESAPAVGNKPFIEVLLSTAKYKIYKQTDAKFQRAEFHTDGVIQSGNRYDEYEDATHYYLVKPGEKPKQVSLKKKMLKEGLGGDADKFISAQGDRDIDDDYLRDLSYSLNQ
jgi:hypothetical protein